jgi:glucuronokinase
VNGSGRGSAPARAALAGNPSDGYGGAVLAVTVPRWEARATATEARRRRVDPPSWLVAATVDRFGRELAPVDVDLRWETSIPQRVGLGSSSALVIAVTRALCELRGVHLEPAALAAFALAVETEELGIAAGLQDRVAQSFGGLMFMDFSGEPAYEPLDPRSLPELRIAWLDDAAGDSGAIHAELRRRHDDGEPIVRDGMAALADAARGARDALTAGDRHGFCECVDFTFELRRRMMELDPRCVAMVEAVRSAGCAANYTGSGGAIVVAGGDPARAAAELERLGCAMIPPWQEPMSPLRSQARS